MGNCNCARKENSFLNIDELYTINSSNLFNILYYFKENASSFYIKKIEKLQSVIRGFQYRKIFNSLYKINNTKKHNIPNINHEDLNYLFNNFKTLNSVENSYKIKVTNYIKDNIDEIIEEIINCNCAVFDLGSKSLAIEILNKLLSNIFEREPELKPLLKLKNKSIYQGEWINISINNKYNKCINLRHGRGIQSWVNGSKYIGYWILDKPFIKGKLIHSKNDFYEGEFINEKAEGYGCYKYLDGSIYEGYWINDMQHGYGKEIWPDGSVFEGNFVNGDKNGKGVFKWSDNSIYKGDFKNNKFHGRGIYIWSDKRIYIGLWNNNRMHGKGNFTWPDNRKYIGDYYNDKKHGYGLFEWSDGRKYRGYWVDGKQSGEGEFYDYTGNSNDEFISNNKQISNNWRKGLWENGKFKHWLDNSIK